MNRTSVNFDAKVQPPICPFPEADMVNAWPYPFAKTFVPRPLREIDSERRLIIEFLAAPLGGDQYSGFL